MAQQSKVDEAIDVGTIQQSPGNLMKYRICGGKTRNAATKNEHCNLAAGYGTDHLGEGRCKFHGGATPRNSGRYSRLKGKQESLHSLIEEHEMDPKPIDLKPDLAMARAVLEDFVSQYEEIKQALLMWNAQGADMGARPQPLPQVADVRGLLQTVGDLAAKVSKIENANAVSRPDFIRIMGELGRIVNTYVEEDSTKEAIKAAWLQVRL
jgi:hypothetical protein